MGEQPFIKFYPSDFLGGTSGLSPAERGVYITLLCLIYEASSPIKRDDSRLARCCGAPKAAFIRILDGLVAQGKITQEGDALSNKRAEKAIVDRTNRTQNATHAAKQRWDAQPEKTQRNQRQDDAPAMPEQCAGDASQNQSQNQNIKTEPIGSAKKRRNPEVEIPEGWVPNDSNIADAFKRGFSQMEIEHEADKFRNHHLSKQSRYRDWNAAWRTWLANARKFQSNSRVAGKAASPRYGSGSSIASIVARRRAEGSV
jgi:uncharacterized protein YdaU (DUF1376 family)